MAGKDIAVKKYVVRLGVHTRSRAAARATVRSLSHQCTVAGRPHRTRRWHLGALQVHELLLDLPKFGSHALGHRLPSEHEAAAVPPGRAVLEP